MEPGTRRVNNMFEMDKILELKMYRKLADYMVLMDKKAGASDDKIQNAFVRVGDQLPKDYLSLLRFSNGVEGRIGNQYLILWSIEEIIPLNEAYEIDEFAPGLMLFGSDGGDLAYAFDLRHQQPEIVEVPFIGMDLESVKYLSKDIIGFFEVLENRSPNSSVR